MSKKANKTNINSMLSLFCDALLLKIEEDQKVNNSYKSIIKKVDKVNKEFSEFIQNVSQTPDQYEEIMERYYTAVSTYEETYTEVGICAAISLLNEANKF